MKLDRLAMVNRLAEARTALLHNIDVVGHPDPDEDRVPGMAPAYRVLIDGELQDAAIRELLRPLLLAELYMRVALIDCDLAMLGVDAVPTLGS